MGVSVINSIESIKDLWNELYEGNSEYSFFQSYIWMEKVEKRFLGRRMFKYPEKQVVYLVVDDRFIAPLCVDESHKNIEMLGIDSSSDYLSFIYKDSDVENMSYYIKSLIEYYKGYHFILERLNQNNRSCKCLISVLNERNMTFEVKESTCVAIQINNGEGTFIQNCTKNARHSYNQSINRLGREGHIYRTEFLYGCIDERKSKDIYELYLKHREIQSNKAGEKISGKRKLANIARKTLLPQTNIDVLTEYSAQHPLWLACIYIDDKLAGFWEGDESNDRETVCMARTAMAEEYYWYKPGTILMVEFIEFLKNKYRTLDLTRGDEEYKFRFGGVPHYNYCLIFDSL